MKKLELYGKTYSIATDWSEVTLKQQMKVSADSDKIVLEDLKKFAILSGYASIPIEVLKSAHLTDLKGLFEAIAFVNEPIPETPIIEFNFRGNHYYCGQNIVNMEFQDFISIENVIQEYSGNTYMALPKILAIMCKQKKPDGTLESISDYDVLQRAQEFEDLPLTIAHSLSVFFYHSEKIYSDLSHLSLNQDVVGQAIQMKIESVETTLKGLAGQGLLQRCVSGILRIYLKSIKRQHKKHYTSTV